MAENKKVQEKRIEDAVLVWAGGDKKALKAKKAKPRKPKNLRVKSEQIKPGTQLQHSASLNSNISPKAVALTFDALRSLIRQLEHLNAHESVGVFRENGNSEYIQLIIQRLGLRPAPNFAQDRPFCGPEYGVNEYAGALKLFLRQAPDPIIPYDKIQKFIEVLEKQEEFLFKLFSLQSAVQDELPQENQQMLKIFACFLKKVIDNSDHNKMTMDNLAISLGPSVLRQEKKNSAGPIDFDFRTTGQGSQILMLMVGHSNDIFENISIGEDTNKSTPPPLMSNTLPVTGGGGGGGGGGRRARRQNANTYNYEFGNPLSSSTPLLSQISLCESPEETHHLGSIRSECMEEDDTSFASVTHAPKRFILMKGDQSPDSDTPISSSLFSSSIPPSFSTRFSSSSSFPQPSLFSSSLTTDSNPNLPNSFSRPRTGADLHPPEFENGSIHSRGGGIKQVFNRSNPSSVVRSASSDTHFHISNHKALSSHKLTPIVEPTDVNDNENDELSNVLRALIEPNSHLNADEQSGSEDDNDGDDEDYNDSSYENE